ncbi:MAG: TonB-dependent receptor domain-containing protein [Bacteroidales bacterium]
MHKTRLIMLIKMSRLLLITTTILLMFHTILPAQSSRSDSKYQISGKVVEESSDDPLEYATITLLEEDSSMVSGIISNPDGEFTLGTDEPGDYILMIEFVGFKPNEENLSIEDGHRDIDVGKIELVSSSVDLDEVSVTARGQAIDYEIDRKLVHVDEQYSAMSGDAVDVLKNVPSIRVDIEGNVQLRGSGNFTVLIDDRPSVLDGTEALEQIPASSIKDIEIITNPSAKYDPEGTAGIINIITKKRTLQGVSGIAHADVGLDDKYGGDFLLNFRTEKFNFFVGGDYNERKYPGFIETEQKTYDEDTTSFLNSDGDRHREYNRYGGRVGVEWFPDEFNTLSISGRYGGRSMAHYSTTDYEEWKEWDGGQSSTDLNEYVNDRESERGGNFYSINTEYTRKFDTVNENHRFDVHLMLFKREGGDESINFTEDENGEITYGQKSTEGGPAQGLRYRINYENPLSDAFKFELGAQGRIHESKEDNEVFYYDLAAEEFNLQEDFSHSVNYGRNINAMYGIFKGEHNNWGYQAGLRSEYTYRDIDMKNEGNYNIDRWDFFPTLHLSYNFLEDNQFMASYTRRIRRPRGWFLEPFITWSDNYNVRQGNPDLLPEYIDSYELAYQKDFDDKHSVSAELYYNVSENEIERVRSVWRDNIMLTTFDNVGTEYRLGTELRLATQQTEWWESDLVGNFYDYRIKGEIDDREFDRGTFTWSVRWNNIFNVGENTRIQLNPSYDSREVEAQEVEEPEFELDAAIRYSLKNNLKFTLQVRDVLGTSKHESTTEEEDFYSYTLYTRKSPIVMLNITWQINNYRNNRRDRDEGPAMEGGEEL